VRHTCSTLVETVPQATTQAKYGWLAKCQDFQVYFNPADSVIVPQEINYASFVNWFADGRCNVGLENSAVALCKLVRTLPLATCLPYLVESHSLVARLAPVELN